MKNKFALWLSVFLSLGSFVSACGTNESIDTTLVAAEETTTTTATPWSGYSDAVQEEVDAERESVRIYLESVQAQKREQRAAQRAEEERKALLRASRAAAARSAVPEAPQAASEPAGNLCGGDLPPCWVLRRENRNHDPRLWNGGCYAPIGHTGPGPCGSTASGIFQITRGTWGSKFVNGAWVPGFGGYMNAADAPLEVQLQKTRLLWANGKGCSHWSAC